MNTGLPDHLRAGGVRPFVWGRCDCVLFASDWVASQRGVDPLREYRGTYSTALGAQRHIARAGGLLALVSAAMAAAGLTETTDPLPGDVAIVESDQGDAMAIRTRVGWAVKAQGGIVTAQYKLRRAWSV
jgi:hypothetical protein